MGAGPVPEKIFGEEERVGIGMVRHGIGFAVYLGLFLVALPVDAFAQAKPALSGGDTAWIIVATALVLFMTMPGLALFYGGLVRARNVLSVLMHCAVICCVASTSGWSLATAWRSAMAAV